jgi:hypothetical protein
MVAPWSLDHWIESWRLHHVQISTVSVCICLNLDTLPQMKSKWRTKSDKLKQRTDKQTSIDIWFKPPYNENIQTIQFTTSHHHFDTTQNQIRMNNNHIKITSILEEIIQSQQSFIKNHRTVEFTGSKQFEP